MIAISERVPTAGQDYLPAAGTFLFVPTLAQNQSTLQVLPKSFTVQLDQYGNANVFLAPTTNYWAWQVTKTITGQAPVTFTVAVKDTDSQFANLVQVDPLTLLVTGPVPQWVAQANGTVVSGSVNNLGHLILTRADGTTSDAGNVVGPAGQAGPQGTQGNPGIQGPQGLTRFGPARYVCLGDSISIAGDTVAGSTLTRLDSYALYFSLYSGGKVQFVYNGGHGGNMTSDMIARFDTEITPQNPSIVSLQSGTNDFTNGVSNDTFRANIKALVAKIRAINAKPVLMTMPPVNSAATAQKLQIVQNNAWLAYYGASEGIPVIDMYGIVTDPTTGNYLTAMDNGDGIHPSIAGRQAIGQEMANQLGPLLTKIPMLSRSNVDPANVLQNGLMVNSASGLAASWSVNGSVPAGVTTSMVTDANVPGNMQRISYASATGKTTLRQAPAVGAGFSVGDVLRYSCVVTNTAGMRVQVAIQDYGGTIHQLNYAQFDKPVTRGVVTLPDFTVPAGGITNILCDITAQDTASAATTGTIDYGQATLYNLTSGSLLTL